MTAASGMDSHPEVAEISALSEGILPPDRSADIREHLAGCDLCTDVLDSLEEIRTLLGTLPGPPRMPADVAGRIDAALAAEAVLDATRPDVPRGTSTPARVPRGTSTAPAGHPTAPAGPGRPGHPERRSPRGGRRRWNQLLAAASATAALVLGAAVYQAASGGGGPVSTTQADTARQAGASALADPVAQRVRQLLTAATTGSASTPMLTQHSDTTVAGPNGAATAVPDCVLRATQRPQTPPLAADHSTFHGTDAYLVLMPHPGDSSHVDAYVVTASCTAASPGTILYRHTYPR